MCTDVIGKGPLYSVGVGAFQACKAYHDDDRKSPFYPADERVVLRHTS
jgi:hypothetical protein